MRLEFADYSKLQPSPDLDTGASLLHMHFPAAAHTFKAVVCAGSITARSWKSIFLARITKILQSNGQCGIRTYIENSRVYAFCSNAVVQQGMAAVQKLYEACKVSLTSAAAAPPPPLVVKKICHLLDSIKCPDVGLREDMLSQHDRGFGFFGGQRGRHSSVAPRWAPPISYLHLHEVSSFSMGIFCLPTSSTIPLHDHPGMTVFSRLLCGTLHVRSYDWVDKELSPDPSKPRLAKLALDQVMTGPCESVVLFPTTGGNIHAFTAITSCAILDVLTPPYSPSNGRHCTYYRAFPYSSFADSTKDDKDAEFNDESYVYLVEFQPPDDFVVQNGVYRGPALKL